MSTSSDTNQKAKGTEIFSEIPKMNHKEAAPQISAAELEGFRKVLRSRRSIRVFDGTPVPESVMNECLDMALLAPNSSNLQMWEFHWVRSAAKKKALVEACLGQPAAATAAELIVCVGRTNNWRAMAAEMVRRFDEQKSKGATVPPAAYAYYQKLVPVAYTQGPLSVLGLLKRIATFFVGFARPVPREPHSIADMKIWAAKSCALAAENLMLAFRAHGFDTCPMEGLDSARVKRILGLPGDAIVVMAVSVGKRAANGVYGPQLRFDRGLFIKEV